MKEIKLIVIGIVLMIQTVFDIKWKKIPLLVTGGGAIVGIVLLWVEKAPIAEVLMALFPGVCSLLFSRVSREALGYGDGFLLCMMGLFYSLEELLLLLMIASAFAVIVAFVLLIFFHKDRKYEIAFVPFLLIVYVIDYLMKIGCEGK